MIIHLQFGFNQFISFREEDLWNFSQSEHIIGPGSHVEYPTGTKNSNFVEDHPRNIPAKFGSNWPSGFGEEAWNVKSLHSLSFPLFSCGYCFVFSPFFLWLLFCLFPFFPVAIVLSVLLFSCGYCFVFSPFFPWLLFCLFSFWSRWTIAITWRPSSVVCRL
jgi:hypothetical protein